MGVRIPIVENCRRLWVAVLEQAIEDLERGYVYAANAQAWFNSDNEGVGSFLWICRMLNIDPDYAREGVGRMGSANMLRRWEGNESVERVNRVTHA